MYELISYTLSLLVGLYSFLLFLIINIILLVIAIKLLRAPKNIIGNEKNTEIRNPMFMIKYNASFVFYLLKASKKFP